MIDKNPPKTQLTEAEIKQLIIDASIADQEDDSKPLSGTEQTLADMSTDTLHRICTVRCGSEVAKK